MDVTFNGYLMGGENLLARIEHNRVMPIDPGRMPLYLASGGDFEKWLTDRAIDRHRSNSRILKKVLRLTDSSDAAAVLFAHAATITDHFWIKRDNEDDLTYEQIRFREDTFAEIALTGSFSSYSKEFSSEQLTSGSPELTNIGSFEKCWKLEDGIWWLYKDGTPLERFSELFIAGLGKLIGFPMAEYFSSGVHVKSKDFTEGKYNFEPAAAVVGDDEDYCFNYDQLTTLNPDLGSQYLDILYMDALCFNMDRHTKNYGVLRDQATGEVLCMAPNFDNNIALISRGYGPDPTRTNCFLGQSFAELLTERNLHYQPPMLKESQVAVLAEETLPNENIDRKYVTAMVMERWDRINKML